MCRAEFPGSVSQLEPSEGCAVLCLLGELQDVAVAAVQGALGRRAVPALVLGAHGVNDETRRQVKPLRQLGLACPAACHQQNSRVSVHAMVTKAQVFKPLSSSSQTTPYIEVSVLEINY